MIFRSRWIQYVSALFLMVFSLNVSAVNCYEKSPNFIKEGDKYFEIKDTKPLTKKQKDKIKQIFSSLHKRLKGVGVVTGCEGPDDNPVKVITKEKNSAEFSIRSDGGLSVDLDVLDLESGASHNEVLTYLISNDDYMLKEITKNSITMTHKSRRKIGGQARPLYERIIRISLNKGVLKIMTLHYYNGYFAFSQDRKLSH